MCLGPSLTREGGDDGRRFRGIHVISRISLVLAFLAATVGAQSTAVAQSQSSIRGFTIQGPADRNDSLMPRNALGKPCLDMEAIARAHITNRAMLDHVVSVRNDCPRSIKIRVCYYHSDQCNDVDVGGYKRVDTILGTMMGVQYFRYSVTQRKQQ